MEPFVKQGKGKSSKGFGSSKLLSGPTPSVQQHASHELAGSNTDGIRFTQRAEMSSTTLADTRSSRVLSSLITQKEENEGLESSIAGRGGLGV